MPDQWETNLACAGRCTACDAKLEKDDQRILSVFTHQPICLQCKKKEETQPDYGDASKNMISDCIDTTGKPYGDPAGYCFHHFCPYKCR